MAVDRIGSLVKAGEISGVTDESVARWRDGRSRPPFVGLVALCRGAGLSIEWMATGEEPRDSEPDLSDAQKRTEPEQERPGNMLQIVDPKSLEDGALVLLPRLEVQAAAGAGALVESEEVLGMVAFDAAWLRARQITPSAAHIITARGDSMEPTIRNGDMLIVDSAITEAVDSGVYVVVYNGLLLVKRLFLLRSGAVIISSDNKIAGRDEEIAPHEIDQLHIAGRVMWYGRGM